MHERSEAKPPVTTDTLIEELSLQAKGGPNVEPPTAAMFATLVDSPDPAIHSILEEVVEHANLREIGCGPAVSGLRTSLIHYFREKCRTNDREFSDAELVTPDAWKPAIKMLADDLKDEKSLFTDSVHSGIVWHTAATPVKERYASVAAITQLVRERFPAGARALSIGCSIMMGELQLMYSDEYPMSFERVVIGKNQDVTPQANLLVARPSTFREVVGVDIYEAYSNTREDYDQTNAHFALSGLRPSERNDPTYIRTLHELMAKKQLNNPNYDPSKKVVFHQANLLNRDDRRDFQEQFPEPFDVIILNFVTQELSFEEQLAMHEAASQLASENGIIIYNHQAEITGNHGGTPAPFSNVRHYSSYATVPYSSRMHIVDKLHPVQGVQEAMKFRDNRCQVVRLGAARLMVNGSLEPVSDLIKHS